MSVVKTTLVNANICYFILTFVALLLDFKLLVCLCTSFLYVSVVHLEITNKGVYILDQHFLC